MNYIIHEFSILAVFSFLKFLCGLREVHGVSAKIIRLLHDKEHLILNFLVLSAKIKGKSAKRTVSFVFESQTEVFCYSIHTRETTCRVNN